jgi:hypothetical protein
VWGKVRAVTMGTAKEEANQEDQSQMVEESCGTLCPVRSTTKKQREESKYTTRSYPFPSLPCEEG